MNVARIIDKAVSLVRLGVAWAEAIEVACARSYASEVQQERARSLWIALAVRAEREAAAARKAAA